MSSLRLFNFKPEKMFRETVSTKLSENKHDFTLIFIITSPISIYISTINMDLTMNKERINAHRKIED